MDIYENSTIIPLSFSRNAGAGPITGLTVTVTVVNAQTNAVLLASTSCPETAGGSGIYTYLWTHGQTANVECIATYTIAGVQFTEFFWINNDSIGGTAG